MKNGKWHQFFEEYDSTKNKKWKETPKLKWQNQSRHQVISQ
jgi:hypothetical protein